MSNIGAETRSTQIAKWRDAVHKNADLLLAFEMKPTDDDLLAKFRADVSERIKDLADYLANGEWGLFLGTELREPPIKEEREAHADTKARKEAEAKVGKFYDRTAVKCTNQKATCVDGICDGLDDGCTKYKAKGKAKKGGAK